MKTIYAKLLFVFVLIFMIGCLHYQDAITFIKSNYQAQNNQKDYIVKVKTKSNLETIVRIQGKRCFWNLVVKPSKQP